MSLTPGESDGVVKVAGVLLHVSGFAKQTKTDDIHAVFSTALNCEPTDIEVIWADDNSLFVSVKHEAASKLCSDSTNEASVWAAISSNLEAPLAAMCEKERAAHVAYMEANAGSDEKTFSPWKVSLYSDYVAQKLERKRSLDGNGGASAANTPAAKRVKVA